MNINEIDYNMIIEVEKAMMLHDVAVALINKSPCYPYAKDIVTDTLLIVGECFRKEVKQ